jgi:hypothetical protein
MSDCDLLHASLFFLILARNRQNVEEKIMELEGMNVPFLIICGERMNHPNVMYRKVRGKWDAINFGARFVHKKVNTIVLNDVDTVVHNFNHALNHLNAKVDLVYCGVNVSKGPQVKFYRILDPIRKKCPVAASGELMLMRKEVFERVLPIPCCIAEDSYILFKALELGYRVRFCTRTYVTTERTMNLKEEEAYKARTTLGIYQALNYTNPPPWIKIFYALLPVIAPILVLAGEDGKAWVRGIEKAVKAHMMKRYPTRF